MKRKTISVILIITSILFVNKVNATERISQEELNKSSYSAMQEESKQNEIMLLADTAEEPTVVETWDISATSKDHVIATLYSDGKLVVSGTGKMKDWNYSAPWNLFKKKIRKVELEGKIENIGDYAFYGCESLEKVQLNEGIKDIGVESFYNCSNLKEINFPKTLKSIVYLSFAGCSSLEKIELPGSLKRIGQRSFLQCSNLKEVIIEEGMEEILYWTFGECPKLEKVVLPSTLKTIENLVFDGCKNLKFITIPENVISIGNAVFWECNSLTTINIPKSITSIGNNVFYNCTNLKTINVYCNSYAENYVKENYSDKLQVIHKYNIKNPIEAVCEQGGKVVYECTNCKDSYEETVPAKGHTLVIDSKVEPTCTTLGKTEGSHCSVCNKVIVAQEEIPALGHQFGEWKVVKEATCTEDGAKERKCNACDEKETEVIAKLGHSYETKIIPPTKTQQGYIEHTCSRCKNSYQDHYVPALGEEELVMNINEIENQYEQKVVENIRYVIVQLGTTQDNLRKQIIANGEYEILNKDKQTKEKEILATGDVVKFKEKEDVEYIIIVKGDVDGNGIIDFLGDIVLLNNYRLGRIKEISVESKLAGDINENGEIDFINDIVKMNNYRIGILHQLNK